MHASLSDRIRYYASRVTNRLSPILLNRSFGPSDSTILLTAGFNGNLGDQALLDVSRRACIAKGGRPFATSYQSSALYRNPSSIVVMAGGEIGDLWHLRQLVALQPDPSLARISSISFANTFLRSPCPIILSYLRRMNSIHVRDVHNAQSTQNALDLPNIIYAPDITFSLHLSRPVGEKVQSSTPAPGPRRVVINIQAFFCDFHRNGSFVPSSQLSESLALASPGFNLEKAIEGYIYSFGRLVEGHLQRGDSVTILTFGLVDCSFAKFVLKQACVHLPIVCATGSFSAVIRSLAKSDLLYASRYHAHVAGVLAQVPTIGVIAGKKNQGLLRDIGVDISASSVDRDEFMSPSNALDSLLSRTPFIVGDLQLDSLANRAHHALLDCYTS